MGIDKKSTTVGFTSNFGAIAAAAGSAIGLGNIWRFPYTVGQNGGGAFLILYIAFVFLLGVPIMMSEFAIGRRTGQNAVGAFRALAPRRKGWAFVGLWGVITTLIVYSFYSVVTGWTLEYVVLSCSGGLSGKTPAEVSQVFTDFSTGTFWPIFYQVVFLILTAAVILLGVQKGIEKFSKVLMPVLFVLMLLLCVRSVTLPGAGDGLEFLFKPDFSKLTGISVLSALGQAMFSLSIGLGVLVTYGAYVRKEDNLFSTSVIIASADTFIAVLAGVAIFPAVFAFGMSPASGPSLVYEVLPNVFNSMPGGYIFAIIFFVLLTIAALTSTISMMEAPVMMIIQEWKVKRVTATLLISALLLVTGVICTLSFGPLSHIQIFGQNIFGFLDKLTATYMLPLGALTIVIFLGWFYPKIEVKDELTNAGRLRASYFNIFYFTIRYIAPLALAAVLIAGIIGVEM